MNKTHLRIGNLVKYNNNPYTIIELHSEAAICSPIEKENNNSKEEEIEYEDLSELPMSLELLAEYGWYKARNSDYFEYKGDLNMLGSVDGFLDIDFPYNGSDEFFRVWLVKDLKKPGHDGNGVMLHSFSQLQNLVFGVSTNELTQV